jgi:Ca2+-binding EF-hand superfamily protein
VSEDAKLFVERLLKYDPADRPTASEAAHDRWLQMMRRGRRASISSIPEAMDAVQASMESFAGYNTLKRLALMVVAHKSTSEEIGFLRRMFKKYDDDKGFVTLQGFKQALHEYEYTDEEVERIFKAIDIDRTGKVHYFEFLAATIESHGYINEERLAEAFDRLDSDDCGYITVDDLRSFLGEEVPQQYIDRIIAEADISQDRMVDYDEVRPKV